MCCSTLGRLAPTRIAFAGEDNEETRIHTCADARARVRTHRHTHRHTCEWDEASVAWCGGVGLGRTSRQSSSSSMLLLLRLLLLLPARLRRPPRNLACPHRWQQPDEEERAVVALLALLHCHQRICVIRARAAATTERCDGRCTAALATPLAPVALGGEPWIAPRDPLMPCALPPTSSASVATAGNVGVVRPSEAESTTIGADVQIFCEVCASSGSRESAPDALTARTDLLRGALRGSARRSSLSRLGRCDGLD